MKNFRAFQANGSRSRGEDGLGDASGRFASCPRLARIATHGTRCANAGTPTNRSWWPRTRGAATSHSLPASPLRPGCAPPRHRWGRRNHRGARPNLGCNQVGRPVRFGQESIHRHEPVDHARESRCLHRNAGRAQSRSVGFALITQDVKLGCDDPRRREGGNIGGQKHRRVRLPAFGNRYVLIDKPLHRVASQKETLAELRVRVRVQLRNVRSRVNESLECDSRSAAVPRQKTQRCRDVAAGAIPGNGQSLRITAELLRSRALQSSAEYASSKAAGYLCSGARRYPTDTTTKGPLLAILWATLS